MSESCAERECRISPREVVGAVRCTECPHFRIMYRPLLSGGECWDFGKAKCEKHELYLEFRRESQLKKLMCVDEMEKKNGRKKED